jgi:hypothetical protein
MIAAVIPDRFKQSFQADAGFKQSNPTAGYRNVRRPTRGIQLKNDSYAVMRVVLGNGVSLPLVNAGSRDGLLGDDGKTYSLDYSNFLIQSVSDERMEKSQVVETFGEAFVFFFGERPRVLGIQGVLLNTFDFNWEAEWWWNYDNYLRGTKCVEHDARVFLTVDDVMVSGYIMSASSAKSAQERNHVPLGFQLFVTDYTNLSAIGDPSADQNKIPPVADWFDAAQYRPMLLQKKSVAQGAVLGGPLSLIEAFASTAISAIRSTWSDVKMIVNNTLSSIDSMLGNPVRIPVGFEGSLVFDEPEVKIDIYPPTGGPIRYTTFQDNVDEYVAAQSPYASAALDLGHAMDQTFSGLNDFKNAMAMTASAQVEFAKHGMIMTPPMVGKVVALASQTGIGMKVIGSARDAVHGGQRAVGKVEAQGDAAVAKTLNVLTDVALVGSLAHDVDRALTVPTTFNVNDLKTVDVADPAVQGAG